MRILLAGASGFLGMPLTDRLRDAGHRVDRLVRRDPAGREEIRWDPAAGTLDPALVTDVDAVINLAGAGIGDRRWTDKYRRVLLASRVGPTTTLAKAIAAAPEGRRPAVFLSASGVHYYGDTGDRAVDETAPPGQGFMIDMCRAWEGATAPAADAGTRVVLLRTGLPLNRHGGLLKPMLLPFRLGVGGRLGSGRQFMPWISLADWLSAVEFLLDRADISGPVNMTGPEPVRNTEFTRVLARRLHRPAMLPVPAFALRIVIGEFATEALASLRVLPGVLTERGFDFRHRTVEAAMDAAFAR